jgi:hypothetical protein
MKTGVGLGIGAAAMLVFALIAGKGSVFASCPAAGPALPVSAPVNPAPEVPPPSGIAPRFFLVTKIDERQIGLEECTLEKNGVPRVFNVVHVETSWDAFKAFDAAGNKRSADWLRKHLQVGDMLLISADNQPVAPAYLRLLRHDTVILLGLEPAIRQQRP